MSEQPVAFFVRGLYRSHHEAMLSAVAGLDDETFRWRAARSNSIAFDLWHCARSADHLAWVLGDATPALGARIGPRPQLWQTERLGERWGFSSAGLGDLETGQGLDEALAARLPWPGRGELLDYARAAFARADATVDAIPESEYLRQVEIDARRVTASAGAAHLQQVLGWILSYAGHDARHLGMIEALKGVRGMRGTATR